MKPDEMAVFAGSGSKKLTEKICNYLKITPGKNEAIHFYTNVIFR